MALSEVFLSMLVASGFAFLAGVLALLYKSKCTSVKCCCFEILRDVNGEEKLDAAEMTLGHGIGRGHPDPIGVGPRNDTISSAV